MKRSLELQVLLECSRAELDEDRVQSVGVRLESSALNWERLLSLAARHGLRPLLFYRCNNNQLRDLAPEEYLNLLRADFRRNAVAELLQRTLLNRILALFAEHDIAIMPYKGLYLATLLYESPQQRAVGDIDIVVHEDERCSAAALLVDQLHFRLTDMSMRELSCKEIVRRTHHCHLREPKSGVVIELHWNVTQPKHSFAPDWQEIWSSAHPECWEGQEIVALGEEELFVMLATHGSIHRWESLKWLVDLNQAIVRLTDIDWVRVRDIASAWRASRAVNLGVTLAQRLLDAPPIDCLQNQDRFVEQAARAIERLVDSEAELPTRSWRRNVYQAQLQDRVRDRTAYVSRAMMKRPLDCAGNAHS